MKTPMPPHPEPHTYTWSKLEEETIKAAMVAAYREGVEEAAKVCEEGNLATNYDCAEEIRKLKANP